MPSLFEQYCERAEHEHKDHLLVMLRASGELDPIAAAVANRARDHFEDPNLAADRARDMGFERAAEVFRTLLPKAKKECSGSTGEILATEFVDQHTDYTVSIKRLRWKDGRDVALRGDDFIGVVLPLPENTAPAFVKGESKSLKALNNATLDSATEALLASGGAPTPHSLVFVATRLREAGQSELATVHDLAAVRRVADDAVTHMLFVFTQSDWEDRLKTRVEEAVGPCPLHIVSMVVEDHPGLIAKVFEVLNA